MPSFHRQIIKKLIERRQAQIRKVYPGLSCFKEGVRQIPVESVPGIREQGLSVGRAPACGADGQACSGMLFAPVAGETGWKPLGKEKG